MACDRYTCTFRTRVTGVIWNLSQANRNIKTNQHFIQSSEYYFSKQIKYSTFWKRRILDLKCKKYRLLKWRITYSFQNSWCEQLEKCGLDEILSFAGWLGYVICEFVSIGRFRIWTLHLLIKRDMDSLVFRSSDQCIELWISLADGNVREDSKKEISEGRILY